MFGLFAMLGASGCGVRPADQVTPKTPTAAYDGRFYSGAQDQDASATADAVRMGGSIEWKTAMFSKFTFKIPYSSEWTIEGKPLLPTTPQEPGSDPSMTSFYFGKYVLRNSYVREYQMDLVTGADAPDPQERTENDCPELRDQDGKLVTLAPKKEAVGGIEGVSYLVGGASGCATAFDFKIGDTTFTLTKIYPTDEDDYSHEVTPEMQEIVKGIAPAR